jgi:Uma2 family endonuclease
MPSEHDRLAPATYQDVLDAPEHLVAELIEGVLYTSPRPASPHAHTASVLGMDIGSPFHRGRGGPGGWVILDEPELHFPMASPNVAGAANVLVPDLAGWRRERFSQPRTAYFEVAPDWACEVLSPSTALLDRQRKLPIYAGAGVGHVWLVDPLARMLEVYGLVDGGYRFVAAHGEQDRARIVPFDAIELELGALWLPASE